MAKITCLAKLGLLRVSHVAGTSQNGNSYEFYSLERSYKDEQANEWKNERVILRPAELCAVADMLKKSANVVMTGLAKLENARLKDKEASAPAQAAAPADEGEDVPF